MAWKNKHERYAYREAREIFRLRETLGLSPKHDVQAPPDFRVNLMQRIEQLEANRGVRAKLNRLWLPTLSLALAGCLAALVMVRSGIFFHEGTMNGENEEKRGISTEASLRVDVAQLADQIIKAAPKGQKIRLLVKKLSDTKGAETDKVNYVVTHLRTQLAQYSQFHLIDDQSVREKAHQISKERSKHTPGDSNKPIPGTDDIEIMRMLVDVIVAVSVSSEGNRVNIDVRMTEVATGNLLLSKAIPISKG